MARAGPCYLVYWETEIWCQDKDPTKAALYGGSYLTYFSPHIPHLIAL